MELNRVPERRSVTECVGAMSERWSMLECDGAMTEHDGTMLDVASTYVLCPCFEEPSVH